MRLAQLTGDDGGYQGSVVVSGLFLHFLRLGYARRLGLSREQLHRVKVALVGPRETSVLTGSLLPSEAWTHGTVLRGNLGGLCGLAQILGDKLISGEVVVKCDASQETGCVLFESGSKEVHFWMEVLRT